jgi:hypothetical protein
MSTGDPHAARELLVDDIRWQVSAEDQDPSGGGGSYAAITYVWYTSGREARVAYTSRPSVEILRSSDSELRALFMTAVPALAG